MKDTDTAVFNETTGNLHSILTAEGRCMYSGQTIEELRADEPSSVFTLMPFWEACEKKRAADIASCCHPVEEITEEKFMEMLEVLPPQCWKRGKGWEAFRMMEYTCGSITGHYVRVGQRFFFANREAGAGVYDTLRAEIAEKIAKEGAAA